MTRAIELLRLPVAWIRASAASSTVGAAARERLLALLLGLGLEPGALLGLGLDPGALLGAQLALGLDRDRLELGARAERPWPAAARRRAAPPALQPARPSRLGLASGSGSAAGSGSAPSGSAPRRPRARPPALGRIGSGLVRRLG